MANNNIYWVKLERPLFRKPEWSVTLNAQKIGLYKDRETAVNGAISEAERTSLLGRASEIWVDEGTGFTLYKAFKAGKPEAPDEDEEAGDDLDLDESTYL